MDNFKYISVIIPTYNGAKKIVNTLKSLEKQKYKNFEVIVVVDGSTDHSETVLSEFKSFFPLKIVSNSINNGRSYSRNLGVAKANYEILLFIDDDIDLVPSALYQHSILHSSSNSNSVLVGAVYPNVYASKRRFVRYLYSAYSNYISLIDNLILDKYFTSAHFSISRNNFIKSGGFRVDLLDSEDTEYSIRIRKLGIKIEYHFEILGYHNDNDTLYKYVSRNLAYKYWKNKYESNNIKSHESIPIISDKKKLVLQLISNLLDSKIAVLIPEKIYNGLASLILKYFLG